MAQTRLERVGTIFTRVSALLRGGAMKDEDKPIWYVIYKAFPPKNEPRFNRAIPNNPIRNIFYEEDIIRAKFHRDVQQLPMINLSEEKSQTPTARFFSIYYRIEKEGVPTEEVYNKALQEYRSRMPSKGESKQEQKLSSIDVNAIFQE